MKKILSISILLLLCLTSCTDDKAVLTILDRAEAMMGEHSDSAYLWLCKADSAIADQSKKTQMRHLMLKAEATNKLFLQMPSDTLFQEVVDYYDRHGTPNQQLKAHYLLGCIYRDRKEAPQAIQCYYDAVEKADTLSSDCDYITLFSVYGQMGDIFDHQIMPNEAIDAWKQYIKYAQKAGFIHESIRGLKFMTHAYYLERDTDMVLSLEKKVHDLYMKDSLPQAASTAFTMSMYIYINRGDYERAKLLMQTYEKESGLFDKDGNICKGREHYYHCKGLYYLGINQLDSAEYYFKKQLPYGYSFDGYRGLMEVCHRRGDAASILTYYKQYEASFDTLVTNIHEEATRQVVGMYNYTRNQAIAKKKQQEADRNRTIIYMIIILIIIASAILFHLYNRSKIKKQKELQLLNQKFIETSTKYKDTKDELGNIETDFVHFQQKKQEELADLQSQLEEFQKQYGNLKQKEKVDALIQSSILEVFKEALKPKLHVQPVTEKNWNELTVLFSQCLPLLYARMTESNILNPYELRVAMLTRLAFSTKDIAILLDAPKQRISNTKEKANFKLFSDNSARTFYNNLCKI